MVKDWSFGGIWSKIGQEKDPHIYPQVKEKKKELRRKEGKRGEGSHTKTFLPNKTHIKLIE